MIVRECEREFIMIRQHHHAIISETIIESVQEKFFPDSPLKHSVLYAIKMHDYGWENFDKEPFWNDEKAIPYSFIDFPNTGKTVLYKYGIDEVEKNDGYAGLLCSTHYSKFLAKDPSKEAHSFIDKEQIRQKTIYNRIKPDPNLFVFHSELLRLADNFSLFLCLNEPGCSKEETHSFFENGIRLPVMLEGKLGKKLELEWIDEGAVSCKPFLFKSSVTLTIPFKRIAKESISTVGLRSCFTEAEEEYFELKIVP